MASPFGISFAPGAQTLENGTGRGGGRPGAPRTPLQEAVKILSLRLPTFYGRQSIAPAPLLTGGGSMGQPMGATAQAFAQLAGLRPRVRPRRPHGPDQPVGIPPFRRGQTRPWEPAGSFSYGIPGSVAPVRPGYFTRPWEPSPPDSPSIPPFGRRLIGPPVPGAEVGRRLIGPPVPGAEVGIPQFRRGYIPPPEPVWPAPQSPPPSSFGFPSLRYQETGEGPSQPPAVRDPFRSPVFEAPWPNPSLPSTREDITPPEPSFQYDVPGAPTGDAGLTRPWERVRDLNWLLQE